MPPLLYAVLSHADADYAMMLMRCRAKMRTSAARYAYLPRESRRCAYAAPIVIDAAVDVSIHVTVHDARAAAMFDMQPGVMSGCRARGGDKDSVDFMSDAKRARYDAQRAS